jgi:hypothetical protein
VGEKRSVVLKKERFYSYKVYIVLTNKAVKAKK